MGNVAVKADAAAAEESRQNSLAPSSQDAIAFRKYTQRVWSKAAGRPISAAEADQIIEDFGRYLDALAGRQGDQT